MTITRKEPATVTSTMPDVRGHGRNRGRGRDGKPTNFFGIAIRMPFWIFTAALAVIFLYPLVWTAVRSVSPLAGTNQTEGWGLGNYITLAGYQRTQSANFR